MFRPFVRIMVDFCGVFPRKVVRIRMTSRNSLYNAPGKEVSRKILQENPWQNPPKIVVQKSPTSLQRDPLTSAMQNPLTSGCWNYPLFSGVPQPLPVKGNRVWGSNPVFVPPTRKQGQGHTTIPKNLPGRLPNWQTPF